MKYRLLASIFCSLQLICTLSGQTKFGDCATAWILCDKSPVFINQLSGYGSLSDPALGACFGNDFAETNSAWFKWQVAEAGTLDFTILPLDEADDIDFVVYRLGGLDNCTVQETVRCMAAGPRLGNETGVSLACTGATGLRPDADANSRSSGCPDDGENFLRSMETAAGEYYALFINNFHSPNGVLIEWGGNSTFQQFPEKCSSANPPTSPTLNNGGQLHFSEAFPNPASNSISIVALSDQELSGQLQIIGSNGQLELTRPFSLLMGSSTLLIPTENLRNGIHFIKLRTDSETHVLRFVKE